MRRSAPALVGRSLAIHALTTDDARPDARRRRRRSSAASSCSTSTATIIAATAPAATPTPQAEAPDINIGTFSMPRDALGLAARSADARRCASSISTAAASTCARMSPSRARASRPASSTRAIPASGCAIAIEFKKFFMDEWTGEPDPAELDAMRGFIDAHRRRRRGRCSHDRAAAAGARARAFAAGVRPKPARFARRSAKAAARISTGRCPSSSSTARPIRETAASRAGRDHQPRLSRLGAGRRRCRGAAALRSDRRGDARAVRPHPARLALRSGPPPPSRRRHAATCRRSPRRIGAGRRRGCRQGRQRARHGAGQGRDRPSPLPGRAPRRVPISNRRSRRWSMATARSRISRFGLPQIHRSPGGQRLSAAVPRAFASRPAMPCCSAACAFMADGEQGAPAHYRALGRSAFLAAAQSADRKLDRIARSFDFLLSDFADQHRRGDARSFSATDGGKPPRLPLPPARRSIPTSPSASSTRSTCARSKIRCSKPCSPKSAASSTSS